MAGEPSVLNYEPRTLLRRSFSSRLSCSEVGKARIFTPGAGSSGESLPTLLESWVIADEIEEYLDAFDNVHRLALRLHQVADQIANVADTIKQSPQMALAVIPNDWPTGEKLRVLVTELASAKAQLPLLWN